MSSRNQKATRTTGERIVSGTKRAANFGMLLSAALATESAIAPQNAEGQGQSPEAQLRFAFSPYRDSQQGGADRMEVNSPMMWFKTPVGSRNEIEGSFVYDAVSGASPWYLNSLSGASGIGIDDTRKAGDLLVTHYFDRASIGIGGAISTEDDYDALNGKTEVRFWTEDKNTIFSAGFSADSDEVSSTIDESIDEDKTAQHYLLGVTQLISPASFVQMNLTASMYDGFLSDPYKILDNRPRSKNQWAWMTRYRLFLPDLEAALHSDYRFYWDSFGVASHMIEVALYQPIFASWTVRPTIRYYSQKRADFFEGTFPPAEENGFFTADQRMGDFGSITAGLKVIKDLGKGFSAEVGFDFMEQRPEWKLGGAKRSEEIGAFYAQFFYFGLAKRF